MAVLALVLPAPASAHARSRPVALDFTLRIDRTPPGVRASVLDGARSLRLRVDPATRAIVLGALDEPMLRFDRSGVWANRDSVTADADRIVPAGSGWTLLTDAHVFRWHDHRLTVPQWLPAGRSTRWTLKLKVDGQRAALVGTFTRFPRPRLWPWLAAVTAVVGAVAAYAYRRPRRLASVAAVVALVAAVGALALSASFSAWIETGLAGLLIAAVAYAFLHARARATISGVAGATAAALGLGYLAVFRHGVVLSSLPPWLARLATAAAFAGGALAMALGVVVSESRTEEVGPVRSDVGAEL